MIKKVEKKGIKGSKIHIVWLIYNKSIGMILNDLNDLLQTINNILIKFVNLRADFGFSGISDLLVFSSPFYLNYNRCQAI